MLKVGDKVRRVPVTFWGDTKWDRSENGAVRGNGPLACRVVYIHPLKRYHMVEFETPGGIIRECFQGVLP